MWNHGHSYFCGMFCSMSDGYLDSIFVLSKGKAYFTIQMII